MIEPTNNFALLACIAFIVLAGYLAERTRIGSQMSAPLIILLLSFLTGSVGLLPNQAPVYDLVQAVLVPLAIPMLLFQADLRLAFLRSKTMVLAFLLVTAFTITGAVIGSQFSDIGQAEPQIVGALTASYIGGSVNFVATAQATGFQDSSLYTAALTADALGAIFFLLLLMSMPAVKLIKNRFASAETLQRDQNEIQLDQQDEQVTESGVIATVFTSALICVIGAWLAEFIPVSGGFIMAITLLALLVANFAPARLKQQLAFDYKLGTLLMYMFFATIGLGANFSSMISAALPMLQFVLILVMVHLALICWLGAKLKFTLEEMMVASSACILGPAAAAALAASKGWRYLVTPGVLVGVLGYAIANFIGITLASFLQS